MPTKRHDFSQAPRVSCSSVSANEFGATPQESVFCDSPALYTGYLNHDYNAPSAGKLLIRICELRAYCLRVVSPWSLTLSNFCWFNNSFLCIFLLLLSGCGVSSPPTHTETPSSTSPAASTATDIHQKSPPNAKSAEVAEAFTDFDAAVADPTPSNNPPINPVATNPVATDTNQERSELPQAPAIPLPSAEQLAKWESVPFDRLKLLHCRDSAATGFVAATATFDEGDSYVLAGSRLTAWSVNNEAPIAIFPDPNDPSNEQKVKTLCASADGKWLASGDSKGNLQIWELPSYKPRAAKKVYPSAVAHLTISPDSKMIATASFTGEITVWDPADLTPLTKFVAGKHALQAILFVAPNRIAVAGESAAIWSTETGTLEQPLSTGGYNSTLALSANRERLAYSKDGKIELWNISDNKVETAIHGSFSNSDLATFSPDGKYLATASKFLIQVLDIASGQAVQVIDTFGWQTVSVNWLPKTNLLMIASENGRVRFWGNASAAAKLNWKPLHDPIEQANPQLLEIVDLRTLPRLPSSKVIATNETMVMYSTTAFVDEAKVFYHYILSRDGWTQVNNAPVAPDALNFVKRGYPLSLYLSRAGDQTQVNLSTAGNVDLREAPKFDAQPLEVVYEAENVVHYRVTASLVDIETSLIRKFHQAGWTAFARLNTSKIENANTRDLDFIRGATTVKVMIQPQPAPAQPDAFSVSYSKFATTKSLPIPVDSSFVEFDGSTQPLLVASTAMSLEETRDFYAKQMAAEGWLRRDSGSLFKEKAGWMDFIRGQCDVSLALVTLDSGRTQIRVGEDLENASWQLRKPDQIDANVEANGIEAADVPALNGSAIIKYDPERQQIDLIAKGATTLSVLEAYGKELISRGWKTDGRGVKSEEYALDDFNKDKAEITLRATLQNGEVRATISGTGLLWNKPLPVAKQIVAFETWLRTNRHPASLEWLDQYATEMKQLQQPNTRRTN